MTFKAGDLVILVRAKNPTCQHLIGSIRMLERRWDGTPTSWFVIPPCIASNGLEATWAEVGMRPINNPGDDEVDEISLRRVIPEGEIA